jgi:hypothetical protein
LNPTERPGRGDVPVGPSGAAPDAGGVPADATPAAAGDADTQPAVENRWWVDTGGPRDRQAKAAARAEEGAPIVGAVFFKVGLGFDQDRARANLTDTNLNLIREANPAEGTWGYLAMTEQQSSPEMLEKVRRALKLPKWARGVLVDSGTSLRAIASGTPVGERIVELSLGGASCFDAWAGGEWVREKVFRSRDRALREGGRLIVRYLRTTEP